MSSTFPPGSPENGGSMANGNGSTYDGGAATSHNQDIAGSYSGSGDSTNAGATSMRDSLASLKGDLDSLMLRMTGMSEEDLNAAYDRIIERFNTLSDSARDMATQASDQFNHSVEATTDYVKEKPLQSVGIAAGVGLLIGLLMSRR